jgi:hypothetical protein
LQAHSRTAFLAIEHGGRFACRHDLHAVTVEFSLEPARGKR